METLKNTLRDKRKNLNISLEEIAQKTNISLKELKKIEENFHNTSIKNAMKIAKVLNSSVEDIFYVD